LLSKLRDCLGSSAEFCVSVNSLELAYLWSGVHFFLVSPLRFSQVLRLVTILLNDKKVTGSLVENIKAKSLN